jgi:hypothetical protein
MDERIKHTVVYRSGVTIDLVATKVVLTKRGATITKVEWSNDIYPRPLHIGVDEIAAVWTYE